jgi:hypothetical protein
MADDIIANAQAAAQTPANGAPAPEQQQQQQATPSQLRVAELNRPGEEGIYSKDPVKQKAAMIELRAAMAASESPEDRVMRADQTIEDKRSQFGVPPPTLPPIHMAEYMADYQAHEGDFYDLAHASGLEARQVRGLRDAGIELGQRVGASGQPASEADLARVFDKYGIPASARPKLVAYWRTIEGKPA